MHDAGAAAVGFITAAYIAVDYPQLAEEIAYQPPRALIISVVLLVLIVEAVRRTAGPGLVILLAGFLWQEKTGIGLLRGVLHCYQYHFSYRFYSYSHECFPLGCDRRNFFVYFKLNE